MRSVALEAVGGFLFGCCFAAVAPLASVTVRHPYGFDGLAVSHPDQIALGAVDRTGGLEDFGKTDGVAFGGQGVAERLGKGGDLVERSDALAIKGFVELGRPVGLLAETGHEGG